jgi:uncharacterized membrane protein
MLEHTWECSLIFWEIAGGFAGLLILVILQIAIVIVIGVLLFELCKGVYYKINPKAKKRAEEKAKKEDLGEYAEYVPFYDPDTGETE